MKSKKCSNLHRSIHNKSITLRIRLSGSTWTNESERQIETDTPMTTTTYKHHEQVMCCQDHNDIIIIIASDLSALETGILCHCFLKSDIYYDFMMTCMPHYCQCSGRISLNLNSVQPLRIYSLLSRIPSEDGSSRSEMKKLHSPTKIN